MDDAKSGDRDEDADVDNRRQPAHLRRLLQLWRQAGPVTTPFKLEVVDVAFTRSSASSSSSPLSSSLSTSLLLTSDQKVYTFRHEPGSLDSSAAIVPTLSDRRVSGIACGAGHMAAVCEDGDLYMWGNNDEGQCGATAAADPQILADPTPVVLQDHVHYCTTRNSLTWCVPRIRRVSCGDGHTVALTTDGFLWMWGKAISEVDRAAPGPGKVRLPPDRRAIDVACGSHHTLAILVRTNLPSDAGDQEDTMGETVCPTCVQMKLECSGEGTIECSPNQCPLGLSLEEAVQPDVAYPQKPDNLEAQRTAGVDAADADGTETVCRKASWAADAMSLSSEHLADADVIPAAIDEEKLPEASLRRPSLAADAIPSFITDPSIINSEEAVDSCEAQNELDADHDPDREEDGHVRSARSSLTESLRHSVGLLDIHSVASFLSRQFTNVSENLYPSKEMPSSVAEQRNRQMSKSLPRSSADGGGGGDGTVPLDEADGPQMVNRAATIASELSSMETFRFVSKMNWATADSSSTETIQESQELELRSFENNDSIKDTSPTGNGGATAASKASSIDAEYGSAAAAAAETRHRDNDTLDTEVWSWGCGDAGQLGHGDTADRSSSTCVASLNGHRVVKVAAGHSHSMALTVDGRVFYWGANRHGQLAFGVAADATDHVRTPVLISFTTGGGLFIEDIAAGHEHSLFLAASAAGHQTIYYMGKRERAGGNVDASEFAANQDRNEPKIVPARLADTFKDCRVRGIFSSGALCGSLLEFCGSNYAGFLRDLSLLEHRWLLRLNELKEIVVLPTLTKGGFLSGPCNSCIQLLLQSFVELAENAAANVHRLYRTIRNQTSDDAERAFHRIYDVDEQAEIHRTYASLFCDVLAIGGFASSAKTHSTLKQAFKVLKVTQVVTGGHGKSEAHPAESWQLLMEEPIQQISQYERLFADLVQRHEQGRKSGSLDSERRIANKWRSLAAEVCQRRKRAERTRSFWDSCPSRLLEQFRTPRRRVVCESRSQPVTLLHAGRFSSHTFVLFNDTFVHVQYSGLTVHDLLLVWVEPVVDLDGEMTAFTLTFPEDSLTLCTNAHAKADWVRSLNDTVRAHILSSSPTRSRRISFAAADKCPPRQVNSPPLGRYAAHTFAKIPAFKDATYTGTWLYGQMHGRGQLSWSDGRKYAGNFKNNQQHGYGCHTVRQPDGQTTEYEGTFKNGKLNGLGQLRFPNGDTYDGFFRDGLRHGHGVFKQGHYPSSMATIYVGQWANDVRSGYGVTDDIGKGEKYMGMWSDGERHGNCALATIDGLYYEGTYDHDKMAGFGLMSHDGSWYEGELAGPDGQFNGKGILTLPCGDTIKGTFGGGSFSETVRVNGTYTKMANKRSVSSLANEPFRPALFGHLCVPADDKWTDIFGHCREMLGLAAKGVDPFSLEACNKAWEAIAISVTHMKHRIRVSSKRAATTSRQLKETRDLNVLERIPKLQESSDTLTQHSYEALQTYLLKAFESPFHPLGRLVDGLVDVYRVTYVGIGAHACLLSHAVAEVFSFVERIYDIVRILFPLLPPRGEELLLSAPFEQAPANDDLPARAEFDATVVTANSLLLPVLLPRIYPALFTLYTLYNEPNDLVYWETLLKWNKQPDFALMAFLQVDMQMMSYPREVCYIKAIDTLQQLSTKFCPQEKLQVLQCAFEDINNEAQRVLGITYTWTMDDLFPVFQYVVIRSRIRYLGSELHMIENLMEPKLQNGELGIMFTMLRACYFQVSNECALNL